jgi:hypothetical protein
VPPLLVPLLLPLLPLLLLTLFMPAGAALPPVVEADELALAAELAGVPSKLSASDSFDCTASENWVP